MKLRQENYYYTACIIRAGKKIIRQGCIHAVDELAAIDSVYEMGRNVWNRPILEVVVMDPLSGGVLATSKMGERIAAGLMPDYDTGTISKGKEVVAAVSNAVGTDTKKENTPGKPWLESHWLVADFGILKSAKTFARLKST